jgi:hypothetical protein
MRLFISFHFSLMRLSPLLRAPAVNFGPGGIVPADLKVTGVPLAPGGEVLQLPLTLTACTRTDFLGFSVFAGSKSFFAYRTKPRLYRRKSSIAF